MLLADEKKNEKERSENEGKFKKLTINSDQFLTETRKRKEEFFIKRTV